MRRGFVLLLLFLAMAPAPASAEDGAERVGLVRVRADGPCRIPIARLKALGIDDPYRLELRRDGKPVPLLTSDEVRVDPDHVVFAARDTARPGSAVAVYELWRLPKPRAVLGVPASLGVPLPRGLSLDRFHGPLGAADAAIYDPGAAARPHWFLAVIPRRKAAEIRFAPYGAKPGTDQKLEVTVYGTWDGLAKVHASWGGKDLGVVATADPSRVHTLVWHVPADLMPLREAPLILSNVSAPPAPPARHDVSHHRGTLYVDRIRLLGDATYMASWKRARVVEVERARAPSDPLATAGDAAHVILATPPLLEGARRLAAHRSAGGIASAVVPVTQVYDRFGHGHASGDAIRAFVQALRKREKAPLRYLVLAGDATYDRTDILDTPTIPARMAYTMYNGATPADALYAGPGGPEVGRLPFDQAGEMNAFVDRLVRYETKPPVDPTRRMLRFVTSPGRFGVLIDNIIESRFKSVLRNQVPPAYDVSITYANPSSPYLWPPQEFSDHVIEQMNAGSLFFTYVGHGLEKAFDMVHVGRARHPILNVGHVERIDAQTMPPIVFVLACTTAMFDGLQGPGIGEALMRRTHGPIAYVGATRVCHPGYNALFGESIAAHMAKGGRDPRLGPMLAAARADATDPSNRKIVRMAITQLGGAPSARIAREGTQMYVLLGDPATRLPIPTQPLAIQVAATGASAGNVTVTGPFPAGARVVVTLDDARARKPVVPHPDARPDETDKIRANHAAANRWTVAQTETKAKAAGTATVTLDAGALTGGKGRIVKVWVEHEGRVWYGGVVVPKPAARDAQSGDEKR